MDVTWIKSFRKILNSEVFQNPDLLQLWIYCLHKAGHTERWVKVKTGRGYTQVKLLPGQFIFGSHQAGDDLKQSWSSTYKRLQKLKKMKNVVTQKASHYSVVTICNWHLYQNELGNGGNPHGNPSGNPRKTNNKDKNEIQGQEEEKETPLSPSRRFVQPTIEELKEYAEEIGFTSFDAEYFYDYQEARGWVLSNGKKMRDWKATVRYWKRNNIHRKAGEGSSTKAADVKGLEQFKKETDEARAKIRDK